MNLHFRAYKWSILLYQNSWNGSPSRSQENHEASSQMLNPQTKLSKPSNCNQGHSWWSRRSLLSLYWQKLWLFSAWTEDLPNSRKDFLLYWICWNLFKKQMATTQRHKEKGLMLARCSSNWVFQIIFKRRQLSPPFTPSM